MVCNSLILGKGFHQRLMRMKDYQNLMGWAMADEPEVCAGLFKPCSKPVTHHLEDPDKEGQPIPLCDEHWKYAMDLEHALGSNSEFRERFAKAVDKASIPTRYERKPVI